MAHHALARALERLVPFYRGQMVRALALALAGDGKGAGREYRGVLDAGEIERAHRLAAALRAQRDAALFERRLARRIGAFKTLLRRLLDRARRRNT